MGINYLCLRKSSNMPSCKNGKGFYKGTEPSPKGRGFCAKHENIGTKKRGKDKKVWVVRSVKMATGKRSKRWFKVLPKPKPTKKTATPTKRKAATKKKKTAKRKKLRGGGEWWEPVKHLPDGDLKNAILRYKDRGMSLVDVRRKISKTIANATQSLYAAQDPGSKKVFQHELELANDVRDFIKMIDPTMGRGPRPSPPPPPQTHRVASARPIKPVPGKLSVSDALSRKQAYIDVDPDGTVWDTFTSYAMEHPFLTRNNIVFYGRSIWSRDDDNAQTITWNELNRHSYAKTGHSIKENNLGLVSL